MSGDLNSEEQAVIGQIERFSNEVLAPAAAAIDAEGTFATLHRPALAEMGIMGINLPEAYGGIGLSGPALYCAVEAIAGACGSTASMLTAHFLATDSLLLGADEALKQRLLPAAASGEALGAFALTEPMAGSNPADMRSTATRDGKISSCSDRFSKSSQAASRQSKAPIRNAASVMARRGESSAASRR